MIFFGWIKFTLSISAGRWSSSTCASHMFCSLKNGWLSFGLCLVMTSHGWPFSRPSDEQRIPTKWGVVPTNQWNRNKISRQISSEDFQVNQWIRSWIYPAPFICFNYPTHQLLRFIQFLPFFTHKKKRSPRCWGQVDTSQPGWCGCITLRFSIGLSFPWSHHEAKAVARHHGRAATSGSATTSPSSGTART